MKLDELKYWLCMIRPAFCPLTNYQGFSWKEECDIARDKTYLKIHKFSKTLYYAIVCLEDYIDLYNNVEDCIYIRYETKIIIFYNIDDQEVKSIYRDQNAEIIFENKVDVNSFPVKIKDCERIDENYERYKLDVIIKENQDEENKEV